MGGCVARSCSVSNNQTFNSRRKQLGNSSLVQQLVCHGIQRRVYIPLRSVYTVSVESFLVCQDLSKSLRRPVMKQRGISLRYRYIRKTRFGLSLTS